MKTKILILATIFMFWANPAFGCIGARAAGMGYAQVACPDDATAAYWNPAIISDDLYVSSGITDVVNSSNTSDYFSFKYKNFGYFKIDYWNNNSYEAISYAIALADKLQIGIGLGNSYEQETQYHLYIFAINYQTNNYNLALLVHNDNYRPSISFEIKNMLLCIELYDVFNRYDFFELRVGTEFMITDSLFFQAGYSKDSECYWNSFGIGIKLQKLSLNYSYRDSDKYLPEHCLSISAKMSK